MGVRFGSEFGARRIRTRARARRMPATRALARGPPSKRNRFPSHDKMHATRPSPVKTQHIRYHVKTHAAREAPRRSAFASIAGQNECATRRIETHARGRACAPHARPAVFPPHQRNACVLTCDTVTIKSKGYTLQTLRSDRDVTPKALLGSGSRREPLELALAAQI